MILDADNERRDEAWVNPPEPKMGYNGYFFELEEENDDE